MSAVCEVCEQVRYWCARGEDYAGDAYCYKSGYELQRARAEKAERERDEARELLHDIDTGELVHACREVIACREQSAATAVRLREAESELAAIRATTKEKI